MIANKDIFNYICAHKNTGMTLYVILLSVVLVLLSVVLLGIRVFFTKNGKFPETHVGNNPALRKKGIHCAKTQDREEQNKQNLFDLIDNIE